MKIVITGGPGGGKTALIELLRKSTPSHVGFVQESASVLFGGGFPRTSVTRVRRAAQRAIFHVQRELEAIVDPEISVVVCDRGALDGLAYWPGEESEFCRELGIKRDQELARYDAVIHLRTPGNGAGYGHQNPLRVETADEAVMIDVRIAHAWRGHPQRWFVEPTTDFLEKAAHASGIVRSLLATS